MSCHTVKTVCKAKNKTPGLSLEVTSCKGVHSLTRKDKPMYLYCYWNRLYCYAAERISWVFDWSGAWGFTVFLLWKGSICCLIQGFQGSNNTEETVEAISAPVLINKNNAFPLLEWFAASSFTPTLCSYQKSLKCCVAMTVLDSTSAFWLNLTT